MKLYLSGGGSGEDSAEINRMFAKSIVKNKSLLYIPIAIDTNRHPYPSCLEYIQAEFKPFNITNITMLTDLSKITREEIEKIGGVYIGGGNTPKLLKEMKDNNFLTHLEYLAKKNIPLAGGSAGAIIFAKTIIPSLSADPNDVQLNDFSALNMLRGYDLWCHYNSSMDKEIKEYQEKYKIKKIIALPENCSIFVDDEKIRIVGKGDATLFTNKKVKYKPESLLP